MAEGYELFELTWQDRLVKVSYQANWLNGDHCHVELRCEDALPVTHTGYRSDFVFLEEPVEEAVVSAYVMGWLDEAAKSRLWRDYLEKSRQLTLF